MKRLAFMLIALCYGSIGSAGAQGKVAIKTNLLYGGYTLTPNVGVEIGLSQQTTLEISGGYNPWNLSGEKNNNKKLAHWLVQAEFRYFLCERFNGHFFGVHALTGKYNINRQELPMLFDKGSKDFRFKGAALGAGISYGYQFVLSKHFSAEATLGVGYAYLNYDQYECKTCGKKLSKNIRSYIGPTKAAISLLYAF